MLRSTSNTSNFIGPERMSNLLLLGSWLHCSNSISLLMKYKREYKKNEIRERDERSWWCYFVLAEIHTLEKKNIPAKALPKSEWNLGFASLE